MNRRINALVFDFDGTIIDTETPVYESWAEAYRAAGAEPIPLDQWLQDIGKADGFGVDIRAELCERLGVETIPAEIEALRHRVRDAMLLAEPVRDGVMAWIDAARTANISLGIASSSPTTWVTTHLARLGLAEHFVTVSCADPGIPGKPDPTVYLTACASLGAAPGTALAIEDSTHGVSAAITAGMRCIATPGPITKTMNFDEATVHVDSLADLDPAHWL